MCKWGRSASADGLWGNWYVPKKDDTIRVTIPLMI